MSRQASEVNGACCQSHAEARGRLAGPGASTPCTFTSVLGARRAREMGGHSAAAAAPRCPATRPAHSLHALLGGKVVFLPPAVDEVQLGAAAADVGARHEAPEGGGSEGGERGTRRAGREGAGNAGTLTGGEGAAAAAHAARRHAPLPPFPAAAPSPRPHSTGGCSTLAGPLGWRASSPRRNLWAGGGRQARHRGGGSLQGLGNIVQALLC